MSSPPSSYQAQQSPLPSQFSEISEVSDLRLQLQQLAKSQELGNDNSKRELFKKVISYMTTGVDVSSIFSEMVTCSATSDILSKKLCYLYVGNYANYNPHLELRAINFLQRDCKDRDPLVRGLALRSLCSLRVPNLVEYLVGPLDLGLKDGSSYVRMVAVIGILKLYHICPRTCIDSDFPSIVKDLMLNDPNSQVVANCISALQEIWNTEAISSKEASRERDSLFSKPIVYYFLNRIKEFNEWAQCIVLKLVAKYVPSNSDEIFEIMNLLEDRLQHANGAVVLATINVFTQLTLSLTDVHQKVIMDGKVYEALEYDSMTPKVDSENVDTNKIESTIRASPTQFTPLDVCIAPSNEVIEPLTVGLKFETWEMIEIRYKNYAEQQGFEITRVSSSFRVNKQRRGVTWRCNCWGKRKTRSKFDEIQFNKNMELGGDLLQKRVIRKSNKCGCPAMVYASLNGDDLWEIAKVINDHENHIPSPSKLKQIREDKFTKLKKRVMSNYDSNSRLAKTFASLAEEYNGREKVSITQNDEFRLVSSVKRFKITDGDFKAMNAYFEMMQADNQNFFYSYRFEENGSLTDVIWVDARSRVAYQEFGDVICFDTSYITNDYDLPLTSFVGVNHHGQSLLLGCALISHEDCETFEWVFKQWLVCMGGRKPIAILTGQEDGIRGPLREVMSGTIHRWCIWHIMQKFGRKLGKYASYEKLEEDLKQAIYDSFTVEEFESRWASAIKDNNVESDEWLKELFKESVMWAPVHMRQHFWAGMMTTQRVKSISSFFDGFVNSKTKLHEFVGRYCSAMRKRVEDEMAANTLSTIENNLSTGYLVEEFFRNIYTYSKFHEVQFQCEMVTYCTSREEKMISPNEVVHVIEDRVWVVPKGSSKQVVTQNKKLYRITYNHDTFMMDCECKLFVTHGIMCRHMIRLLDFYNVANVPNIYVSNRWRRDIRRKHMRVRVPYYDPNESMEGQRHTKMRLAFEPICEYADDGDDTFDIVITMLKQMDVRVKEVKGKRLQTLNLNNVMNTNCVSSGLNSVVASVSEVNERVNSFVGDEIVNDNQSGTLMQVDRGIGNNHLKDTSSVRKRGRPKSNCLQNAHEKGIKTNKLC